MNSITLNIGLHAPMGGENGGILVMSRDMVLEAINDVMEEFNIRYVLNGVDIRESNTEPTAIVSLTFPSSMDCECAGRIVWFIAFDLNQDAIAAKPDNGNGFLDGPNARDWGEFDESLFIPYSQ